MNEVFSATFVMASKKQGRSDQIQVAKLDCRTWDGAYLEFYMEELKERANKLYKTDDAVVGYVGYLRDDFLSDNPPKGPYESLSQVVKDN